MSVPLKIHVRSSLKDAVWTNLTVGMGEQYFVPFLILLGFSDIASGIGAVLPMFIGTCIQLLSNLPFLQNSSLKKRIIILLFLQSICLFLLILVGLFELSYLGLVFTILSFYWAFGLTLLPPWNRLMGQTVPKRVRLKFFSYRLQIGQTFWVIGLISSGILLYFAKKVELEKETFLLIFILCLIFKILSIREFSSFHRNLIVDSGSNLNFSPIGFFKRIWGAPLGKIIFFLFGFYFTVHFSAPFFNPYMLTSLELNYLKFMMVIVASVGGRVVMSRYLRKKAKTEQMSAIFFISCLGVCSTPILWTINQSYPWLLFIEVLSGAYWAMFDLSILILFFDYIKDEERTSLMSYISFTNTLGMCLGALSGGYFLQNWIGESDKYLSLFLVSSLLRFVILLFSPTFTFRGLLKNALLKINFRSK